MSGSSSMSPTVMRGLSEPYGSWKMICISRRSDRTSRSGNAKRSRPPNHTFPAVGSISRSRSRPTVDLSFFELEAHVVHGTNRLEVLDEMLGLEEHAHSGARQHAA